MASDYRYNPFLDALEPFAITGETHVIPTNSPFTIRLSEVPLKESPSTVSLTIGGVAGVEVAADPAAGEFRCDYTTGADSDDNWNTGLIQFNNADAGKTVVASYKGMGTLVRADGHGTQLFTTNGTFTVPGGVTKVRLTGIGGGGAGSGATAGHGGGTGGGSGACCFGILVNVMPTQSYSITIGQGGVGTTTYVSGAGGATSFGALLTLSGGGGGLLQDGDGINGGAGGAGGPFIQAGNAGDYVSMNGPGSKGASSPFGLGGAGGAVYNAGGVGNGYGVGGGGCGYCKSGSIVGAAGKAGFLLVEW